MAGFHAARPMEDFFLNPTFLMEGPLRTTSTMVDDNHLYDAATQDHAVYMVNERSKQPAKPAASITDLVDDPGFWHGYTSEEEIASPVDDEDDDDGLSLHSDESIDSIASRASFPEQLADTCEKVKQRCNQAQAVKIHAAGKAKVVSLPKLVDIPSKRGIVRPASSGTPSKRPSVPRIRSTEALQSTRSSEDSRNSRNPSLSSSSINSPASTAPSSIIDHNEQRPPIKHTKSFSRHIDLMQAVQAISPTSPTSGFNSPRFSQPPPPLKRESTIMSDRSAERASISAKPSVRRMTKFSSNFGLNKFGKSFGGRESTHGNDLESVKEPEPIMVSNAPAPSPTIPTRSTSLKPKPKLVARAANERAPPLVLPPFPDEADDVDEWPLRTDSFAKTTRPHRKSISARLAAR